MTRYSVVATHGEHHSIFSVMDAQAEESEQPKCVFSSASRTSADAVASLLNGQKTAKK